MPIYVYECQSCHATEEHMQRMSDPPMTECQACGGELRKQITPAAFHLKGGGWYKDGYASSKPGGAASGDGGGSSDAGSSTNSSDGGGSSGSGSGSKSDGASKSSAGSSD